MSDPLPTPVLWGGLAVLAAFALVGSVQEISVLRIVVLGLGGLALVPLTGWLRVVSFAPIAAAGAAAAAAAWLLGLGQAVPVAFVVSSVTGVAVAAGVTAAWPRRPAGGAAFVSVIAALVVWGLVLPRLVIRPSGQPLLFGIDLSTPRSLGVLAVGLLAAAGLGLVNVARSSTGREIAAVGVAAELALRSGVDIAAARVRAGMLAGLFAGWAGLLLVLDAGALPPLTQLSPGAAVVWLAVALLGGVGSIAGATLAALAIGGLAALLGQADSAVAGLALVMVAVTGGRGLADLAGHGHRRTEPAA